MKSQVARYLHEGRYVYLFFGILLLGNIVFNIGFIKPRWTSADRMRKEYISLREEEVRLKAEIHEKGKLVAKIHQARSDLKEFIDGLPRESSIAKIRSELYSAAASSGLSISALKYSLPEYKEDGLVKYDISFPVGGSYRKLRKFIYKLEKMPYLMSINDLVLSSSKEGTVSVSIKLSLYLKAAEE